MSNKHKVMIIDDEKIVGDMAKLSLEQEGYEVEAFLNGETALARLQGSPFDVVVTDFKMKGIDGLEVLRTVKKLYPKTVVIMITAFANLDVAIEALRDDVHDFFPKPVKIKELKASIQRALEKRKDENVNA
ncbi:MAG: response regulator [Desulfobacteraceae bacterium]|nr:response regulator [Desulfobacteraceae bacterium]